MTSVDVRAGLVRALQLDLVGPDTDLGNPSEILPQTPSRWYLTGFLIPVDAPEQQRADETVDDELDAAGEGGDIDESSATEGPTAKKTYYPSSCGLSVLVPLATTRLDVRVRWGDYKRLVENEADDRGTWHRTPRFIDMGFALPPRTDKPQRHVLAGSGGLELVVSVRPVVQAGHAGGLPAGAKSVSLFLVNRRTPAPDIRRDEAFVFQATVEVKCAEGFLARPNPSGLESSDWDEKVADLQYRDVADYAVGHNVSVDAAGDEHGCHKANTCWLPSHQVEKVAAAELTGIELSMDRLAELAEGAAAAKALKPMVEQYNRWLDNQMAQVPNNPAKRHNTAEELIKKARYASKRIEDGIQLLEDPLCLDAFKIANRAMALAARRRQGVMLNIDPASIKPKWRPFQLAFILMNLKGIASPAEGLDRTVVDLLFFPTGGGKTEAYLGLAAFTLVLRRLRNPGIGSAGLSVLMRYTLRLLTLDQLGRAATLICALEEERCLHEDKLGQWPFEIGLWVGRAATPNRMGKSGDNNSESARAKTIAHRNDPRNKPSPVPLEECPWCGRKFGANTFILKPNPATPNNLVLVCLNRDCAFSGDRPLPILTVDDPIYRRLPCFMIATVDKFAAMPWTGEVGGFFGRVERYDKEGFYGPCDSGSLEGSGQGRRLPEPQERLLPPDLVIQDELHLISGPLGTMVGLYEVALDELSKISVNGKEIRPKIIASTATVKRANNQIKALFNRRVVDIFPPPCPNRRDSFFAITKRPNETNARLYIGVPAMGRGTKATQLRIYLVLLASAQYFFDLPENLSQENNPADPYMTMLGYFNSLRELGGTRRLMEDQVWNNLTAYGRRLRVGETASMFGTREVAYEPVELTSRISTAKVSEYKRQLSLAFPNPKRDANGRIIKGGPKGPDKPVDMAIATNMISVGLDITRLGLMVVCGQPKTSAEYIQATSRVGRDDKRPGLVVTILNLKKPRDRSHYEQFAPYHESFYRSVEATSVTPFSPRALDRGLAAVLVAMIRQGNQRMTAAARASEILKQRPNLDWVVHVLADRALECCGLNEAEARKQVSEIVKARAMDLMDIWYKHAAKLAEKGTVLQYQTEDSGQMLKRLLYEFLHPDLKEFANNSPEMKFRANRSMRDVEPSVNLFVQRISGRTVEEDE